MSTILWKPKDSDIQASQMFQFMEYLNNQHSLSLSQFTEMHDWSCSNPSEFWGSFWDYSQLCYSSPYECVISNKSIPGTDWFTGASLNYAENCLKFNDSHTAIINADESGETHRTSYSELSKKVSQCQQFLLSRNIKKGDRVAAIVTNCEETIVFFLAVAAIGAIWTSCSPDLGDEAILSRFSQVEPRCLLFVDSYMFKNKSYDIRERITTVIQELSTLHTCVQLDRVNIESSYLDSVNYSSILQNYPPTEIHFEQLPFNHPLYILYSSGTTGKPKSIVHSAGGSLLEHIKEQRLHCNLTRDDVFFYYTSCSWMMWNWLVSGLSTGSTLLVFDGSPFYPTRLSTWKLIDDYSISIYGTSAKFINASSKFKLRPQEDLDLSSLRLILSTGSPLYDEDFDYVYEHVKSDVQLSSISGGTDIVGCFALGNPVMPVVRGELQSLSLGYPVKAYSPEGKSVLNEKGELVCEGPFPSMPIYFWNDPENKTFKDSYFSKYNNIWHHSDYICISDTGGVRILGRSDATLNRAGIRIGTAEIYQVVESLDFVSDSLVIHLEKTDQMFLFVTSPDHETLTPEINKAILQHIKTTLSPRHSPNKVYIVPEIPYTKNGKKIELAVKHIFTGNEELINYSSLANQSSLDFYKTLADSILSVS